MNCAASMKVLPRVAAVAIAALMCQPALARQTVVRRPRKVTPEQVIADMKMMSPGVGWILLNGRLYRTADDGRNWRDITPRIPSTIPMGEEQVFFLDSSRAWVAYADYSKGPSVGIASTANGGHSWKVHVLDLTALRGMAERVLDGLPPASVFFSDSQHGWILFDFSTGTNFPKGGLLLTQDGGATWTELPDTPAVGPLRFTSLKDGWLTGQGNEELWATHDGGRTWQEILLPPLCPECFPTLSGVPKFLDQSDALVAAKAGGGYGGSELLTVGTYVTQDGGHSWQLNDVWKPPTSTAFVSSSIVGLHVIRLFEGAGAVTIRNGTSEIVPSLPARLTPNSYIGPIDFVDDFDGWAIFGTNGCARWRNAETYGPSGPCMQPSHEDDLLSTTDGGKTFKIITPRNVPAPGGPF